MNFLVISHTALKSIENQFFGYGPYVREMNLWFHHVDEVEVVSPLSNLQVSAIDLPMDHHSIRMTSVPSFNLKTVTALFQSLWVLPGIFRKVYQAMKRADHIHIRCPGNMGLIGTLVQILFPQKPKTAKYAGNWDWNSAQPWTYRFQQRILRTTWLTRNIQVLVYGEWSDQNRNILPFFTATYSECNRIPVQKPDIKAEINLLFVGTLTRGKRPLLAGETLYELRQKGVNATLTFCGEGVLKSEIQEYIEENNLSDSAYLLGNVSAERVQLEFQKAHFLLFPSQSEGWPKVVAEAMWWGCIPITTAVSCIPHMVGKGERGILVNPHSSDLVKAVEWLIQNPLRRDNMAIKAMSWSRNYTLERFEKEIKRLLSK